MYYTTLKPNTQKAQKFINAYYRSTATDLQQVYGSFSTAKSRAQYEIFCKMRDNNGSGYRILGANSSFFSCGWVCALGLIIETAANTFLIPYDVATGEVLC